MSVAQTIYSNDLAGVVVGDTAISDVQGEAGLLSYRGIDINELVGKPYAHVAWLVIFGRWPTEQEQAQLFAFNGLHSRLSQDEIELLRQIPRDLHPMLMLQGTLPMLRIPTTQTLRPLSIEAEQGLFLAIKMPALIAAHHRLGKGKEPLAPRPGKHYHHNFLYMFHGKHPSAEQVRILDAVQILQMEHSFNAGTFAGRVCASTEAPIQSSISASVGTLFGRLHGGADQAALEMAVSIGSAEKAGAYVQSCLEKGEKIMGMGHREYRTVDPRARILKPMAMELCTEGKGAELLATLVAVEAACQQAFAAKGKEIWANVEFYKGAVFHSLGIPTDYFTAMFSMARIIGYIAHYLEFSQDSRLIRPRANYTGDRNTTRKSAA
ncbi:MAG: citrate/2-methylcitrate synthase [Pseudomonadota bacterium]